jgi:hypothetical protein
VCVVLLLGLLARGGISAHRPFGTKEYRGRVKKAIEDVPYLIGPAVGVDSEPTPAAIALLTPNKILERRYVDPNTGAAFTLLIVHCGDVRDMIGHFPPVCYPAHGWKPGATTPVPIEINGEKAWAIKYDFTHTDDLFERQMSVTNFFVIPEEGAALFSDMKAVERASRSSETGGLGVAQFQIVTSQDLNPQWRDMMIHETLLAVAPAVKTIAQGIKK